MKAYEINHLPNDEYSKPSMNEGGISPKGVAVPFAVLAVVVAQFALILTSSIATNTVVAANGVGVLNANLGYNANLATAANYNTTTNWNVEA